MGKTITVASQKGGVGKTTTAVNLSAMLSLCGKRVLLFDLDPQGNASSGIGFHRPPGATPLPRGRPALLSAILEGESLSPFVRDSAFENLAILPSSAELSQLEIIREVQSKALPMFRKQIETLADRFDYILVDCPPSLGGLPNIALGMSDAVLIPIQCEYYAMEGLSQILPVVRDLQQTSNPRLEILGILLTMYSDELQLSHDVMEEVKRHFSQVVFDTIIPRDVILAEAASHGLPAFHYEATSKGAWSYIELTKEVLWHERA